MASLTRVRREASLYSVRRNIKRERERERESARESEREREREVSLPLYFILCNRHIPDDG